MTQKKMQKNPYSLWDYPQLTDYLQKMAAEGWMLVNYHEKTLEFTAAEPKKLHFVVSFFPEYVAGETETPEKLLKMWEFAEMGGWQHITGNYHTQVFYNTGENPTPLHTDAAVQLQNYDSIIRKQYLKRWKICAALSGGVFVVFMVLLVIAWLDFIDTEYMTYWFYSLLGVQKILTLYTFGECVFNTVKIVKYKKWHKKSLQTAKDNNNFVPLRANGLSDQINVGISIGALIGLTIQIFSFMWLSFAKTAIEYVLNNPGPT